MVLGWGGRREGEEGRRECEAMDDKEESSAVEAGRGETGKTKSKRREEKRVRGFDCVASWRRKSISSSRCFCCT